MLYIELNMEKYWAEQKFFIGMGGIPTKCLEITLYRLLSLYSPTVVVACFGDKKKSSLEHVFQEKHFHSK